MRWQLENSISRFWKGDGSTAALVLVLLCISLWFLTDIPHSLRRVVESRYEDAVYTLDPSAQQAFEYGEKHFNARDPAEYDINRAEYFFNQAATKDPSIPYLYHELARIDFLRGNFTSALAKVNFQISMYGDEAPNSYYIRGLIEGYMGDYAASARDYEHFIALNPKRTWASTNDYAWVLLKAGRARNAAEATAEGLQYFPDNPWLLNTSATAFYEIGEYELALSAVRRASITVAKISEADWLNAYPGNDPKIAGEGIAAFKKAVENNMHTIGLAAASDTLQ